MGEEALGDIGMEDFYIARNLWEWWVKYYSGAGCILCWTVGGLLAIQEKARQVSRQASRCEPAGPTLTGGDRSPTILPVPVPWLELWLKEKAYDS